MFEAKSLYKFFFRLTLKYFRHGMYWWTHIRNEKTWTISLTPSFILINALASVIVG